MIKRGFSQILSKKLQSAKNMPAMATSFRFYFSQDGRKLPKEMEAIMTSDDGEASFKDQMRRTISRELLDKVDDKVGSFTENATTQNKTKNVESREPNQEASQT